MHPAFKEEEQIAKPLCVYFFLHYHYSYCFIVVGLISTTLFRLLNTVFIFMLSTIRFTRCCSGRAIQA